MRVDDKDSHGWSRIQKANGTPTMVNQPERTTGYLICRFDYVLANEISGRTVFSDLVNTNCNKIRSSQVSARTSNTSTSKTRAGYVEESSYE
jgi:hypothetical protein